MNAVVIAMINADWDAACNGRLFTGQLCFSLTHYFTGSHLDTHISLNMEQFLIVVTVPDGLLLLNITYLFL